MNDDYGRNLDLNLLRVFAIVAETGSVTAAAGKLYLTQPAVSAALRRLTESVGTPLFARNGRGLSLTTRGDELLNRARPHLRALVAAALAPLAFDPATSEHTVRLGLADAAENWLLPKLLRALSRKAPHMRVIAMPVQFRSVAAALTSRSVDMAVTVADEMPAGIARTTLSSGSFVCLFDRRHVRAGARIAERAYFSHEHVVVSYNGDLRGIVEDALGKTRKVRCSLSSFHPLGEVIRGTPLLATVPAFVATRLCELHAHLASAQLPFALPASATELLWPRAIDEDAAQAFVRGEIAALAKMPPSGRARVRHR